MKVSLKNAFRTMLKDSPTAQKQLQENKEKHERNGRLKEKFNANEHASFGKKIKAENEIKELRRKLNASEQRIMELEKQVNNSDEIEKLKVELKEERKKRQEIAQNSDLVKENALHLKKS